MFLGKNKKNLRSLFSVFALATILLAGANTANAQAVRNRLNNFVDVTGFPNRTDFTTLAFPAAAGGPIRWKTLGNPASAGANQAFKRDFDYGISGTSGPPIVQGDSIVVGDYTGDNRSEVAVWRDQATNNGQAGVFYVSQFPTGAGPITLERSVPFGNGFTDIPGVQGDYDGDGKDDYTVVRVSGGNLVWYILSSGTNTARGITFANLTANGQANQAVFPGADFTGDGRDELVYASTEGSGNVITYYIGDAVTGAGVITRSFGNFNTDTSLSPDDYTGDGRADFVAVRQTQGATAVWYIQNSQTAAVTATRFGVADPTFAEADVPVRGDFDGDARHDICVWRASNQTFYYISSQNGSIQGQRHGDPDDFPLGSFGLY